MASHPIRPVDFRDDDKRSPDLSSLIAGRTSVRSGITEMPCNNAMPDFIITGEKVILRKSPNHFQNTLLIGDSTSLPGIKMLIQPGRKSE